MGFERPDCICMQTLDRSDVARLTFIGLGESQGIGAYHYPPTRLFRRVLKSYKLLNIHVYLLFKGLLLGISLIHVTNIVSRDD